jgi:hypothetical protein
LKENAASEAIVSENAGPRGDDMREVEQAAEQVAREAEGARQENERATRRGQETDYAFRLPADVAEADRLRAEDDVELIARQEDVAETQRRAAEALRRNAEALADNAAALDRAGDAVRDNRGDLSEIQQNARALDEQLGQARDQVGRAEVPRVEGGGGRADGERGDNG